MRLDKKQVTSSWQDGLAIRLPTTNPGDWTSILGTHTTQAIYS